MIESCTTYTYILCRIYFQHGPALLCPARLKGSGFKLKLSILIQYDLSKCKLIYLLRLCNNNKIMVTMFRLFDLVRMDIFMLTVGFQLHSKVSLNLVRQHIWQAGIRDNALLDESDLLVC